MSVGHDWDKVRQFNYEIREFIEAFIENEALEDLSESLTRNKALRRQLNSIGERYWGRKVTASQAEQAIKDVLTKNWEEYHD